MAIMTIGRAGVAGLGKMYDMDNGAAALSGRGFWLADGDFETCDVAFATARAVVRTRCDADDGEPLPVIGDFVIPPPDGAASRDFQTLHFDLGAAPSEGRYAWRGMTPLA